MARSNAAFGARIIALGFCPKAFCFLGGNDGWLHRREVHRDDRVESGAVRPLESSGMTKHDLLVHLANVGETDAAETAQVLDVPYAASAMGLLRLVRQHLASRRVDQHRGLYTYQLTDHGHARLAFFEDESQTHPRQTEARPSWRPSSAAKGDRRMKRKKLHTGIYHCPACFVELDLIGEESLKCDQCGGPLAKGDLGEIWADDDEE